MSCEICKIDGDLYTLECVDCNGRKTLQNLCFDCYIWSLYMKSIIWKQIRKIVLERDKNKCKECGGLANSVHHLNYESWPREYLLKFFHENREQIINELYLADFKNREKLISICQSCHGKLHLKKKGDET